MAHAVSATAAADIPGPLCLVCERPLEYRDKWPGEIKGRYVCLRCALTVVGFWQDGDDEGVSQEEGAVLEESGDWTPLANPRAYHHRKSPTGRCSICGARSVTIELNYGRAFCTNCLNDLARDIVEWRKRRR